ncbi:nicotinate-nucleotide adenylyltransferase [Pseudoduganella sp. GCM10020061]|uniref:nicotinate-nucleotide adenylyltransferase n=1 Tax=Pseudoduganella sp. GCM10020061 TaxID=3317345 RepID=UPI003625D37D
MTLGPKAVVALLGGSFDPVHHGHVALASLFNERLRPDQLRVIPAGNPWQKAALKASAEHRVAMLELAFGAAGIDIFIDTQEIGRGPATYAIDTLRNLRKELGPDASLVFLMGADQLQHLDSWRDWLQLFDLTHFAVAARPGYALDRLPPAVQEQVTARLGTAQELRDSPSGRILIAPDLAIDISATEVREALAAQGAPRQHDANSLIPGVVLDYIQQHHLYKQ